MKNNYTNTDFFQHRNASINIILKYYRNKIKLKSNFFFFIKYFHILFYDLLDFFLRKIKFLESYRNKKKIYNLHWKNFSYNEYFLKKYIFFKYKNKKFICPKGLTTKIFQSLLLNEINLLKSKYILEIGSGNGLNLLFLSSVYPQKIFTGIDLSNEGVSLSKEHMKKKTRLDKIIFDGFDLKNKKIKIANNLEFHLMNANNLKFNNNSFDLVFTSLALEQMDSIKFEVLREILRVSKKYVILFEPFSNLNREIIASLHHKLSSYFNMSYSQLNNLNIKILKKIDNFPQKINRRAGFVVFEKM